MLVNSDFSRRAAITPDQYLWIDSPQPGVSRVMLDRTGGEVARATSIVRYAEGSRFPSHQHPGGEEILVLDGTFSEDGSHYPAGWYLRNPPGSAHSPSSGPGATIFVKLCQMPADEQAIVRVNTRDPGIWSRSSSREVCELFNNGTERAAIERVDENCIVLSGAPTGAELLVVEGELFSLDGVFVKGSWLRLPPGDISKLCAGRAGATVYLKTGHLRSVVASP